MMTHSRYAVITATCLLALLSACSAPAFFSNDGDPALVAKAESLRKSGDATAALQLLRDADNATPNNAKILQQLGYALIETNNPEEAVRVFDRLIAIQPDKAVGYTGKGVAFDRTGNHLAAQDIYEVALRIEPDSLPAKNNLAMSLILNNQPQQAIALLEPLVIKTGNDNDTVRRNLALAYGVSGNTAKALAIDKQDMPLADAQKRLIYYSEFAKTHKLSVSNKAAVSSQIGFEKAKTKPAKKAAPKAAPKKIIPTDEDSDTDSGDDEDTFLGKPITYSYPASK